MSRRWYFLKHRYGLSESEYRALFTKQNGGCGVCGSKENKGARNKSVLDVDHDHVTQTVRGLLCRYCNNAIGVLGDSVGGLMAAIDYLQGTPPPEVVQETAPYL